MVFADAGTRLCPGDQISAFTRPGHEDHLRHLFEIRGVERADDPTGLAS
jgi:hypothetical protein